MNIYGKRVILRAFELRDMDILREMFNDPTIEQMVVGWAWPVSEFSQEQWFRQSSNNGRDYRFIIEYEGKAVGSVNLTNIDWKDRKATTAIKLHESCPKQKGIGTDAVMALQRYAFETLQLHRLEGSWLEYNKASENLHLKCGWVIEGIQRQAIYKDGKYHDLKVVGLLREDYLKMVENNKYWES